MFSSILIANRGEIACRIAHTAKRLGLRVIAVYSQADEHARHVRLADEAHYIGPAPVNESYLCGDKILEIAKTAGAECLHPGYGFLSENAEFAENCEQSGITFVGPPASAIVAMGLKDKAKALMEKAGVPVVPGYQGSNQEAAFLKQKAYEIGYPVMIKAVAGGGGKGMRQVETHAAFDDALASCQRESAAAFGDDRVLIEKFIANPRHIEMQIFGDKSGNAVHLFERDCSLQRRHQKVIEEAPAPGMTEDVRNAMGDAAVAAAKAVAYVGAGTVEFIVDGSDGLRPDGFYFMEMNTRLQVEHPVTELITGFDLVEWQLRIADGENIPVPQEAISINGHAFEARLYAEDPATEFLPQTGKLHRLEWPHDEAVRIDTGIGQGDVISPFYDPMIAKVIVSGKTRQQALAKLAESLQQTTILGLRNNIGFLTNLARHEKFINAQMDTGFIDAHLDTLLTSQSENDTALAIAGWVQHQIDKSTKVANARSPWQSLHGWSLAGTTRTDHLFLLINGEDVKADIIWRDGGFAIDDKILVTDLAFDGTHLSAVINGKKASARTVFADDHLFVNAGGRHFELARVDLLTGDELGNAGSGMVKAPMPGKVIAVNMKAGDKAVIGDVLLVLEAMKMEHSLCATVAGQVGDINVKVGDQVGDGQVLVVLEPDEA